MPVQYTCTVLSFETYNRVMIISVLKKSHSYCGLLQFLFHSLLKEQLYTHIISA